MKQFNNETMRNLYGRYSASLYKFISLKVEKHEDREEILQDTWMSIYDSLPMFNKKSSFLTWAKAIASHEVCDFYRKRKLKTFVFSRLPFLGKLISQALGPDLEYEKQELKKEMEQAMKGLSEGYSQILRLKYIDDCSVVTIARLLKTTAKAAESRLFRARLAFQKIWNENSYKTNPSYCSSGARTCLPTGKTSHFVRRIILSVKR